MSLFKTKYYSPKETSQKLGVHFQTLRNWEKEGKIKCVRSPGGKRFYDLNNLPTPPPLPSAALWCRGCGR